MGTSSRPVGEGVVRTMSKQYSRQFLANIVIIVLVCYLILTVEQLRHLQCESISQRVAAASKLSNLPLVQQPPEKQQPVAVPNPVAKQNPQSPPQVAVSSYEREVKARHARPFPACAQSNTRAKTYLMVFMGHSGSSALISELKQHPSIYFEGAEPVDHQKEFNTTEALQITRRIFDNGIAKGQTPGFKIRPAHILKQPEAWRALVRQYQTRIIWQYRQNIFKAGVGEYSYQYLNDTSVVEGLRSNMTREERCKIGAGCSFRIESMAFFHKLLINGVQCQSQIAKAVHAITNDNGCVRELPYEDYLYHREETLTDVFRFLGVQPILETKAERFKATSDSMCEVIENWGEVCKNFYGCTLWQHMLNDAHNNCFCSFASGPTQYCTMTPMVKTG